MKIYDILELQKMNMLQLLEIAARYPVMCDGMGRQEIMEAILDYQYQEKKNQEKK